jgi:hypothetical protein
VTDALTAAVSVSHTFEQIGSYAGLASMIGLGVLALLYFAQARELKRLRDWAGRAPERAAEMEQRVQADAQRRVIAQPQTPAAQAAQTSPTAGLTGEAATRAAAAAIAASRTAVAPAAGLPGRLARPAPAGGPPAAGAVPAAPGLPGAIPTPPGSATPGTPPGGAAAGSPPGAVPGIPPGTTTPAGAAKPGAVPPAPASSGSTVAAAQPAGSLPPSLSPAAAALAAQNASKTASGSPRVVAQPAAAANGAGQETRESDAARPLPPPPPIAGPSRPAGVAPDDDGGGTPVGRIVAIVAGALVVVAVLIVIASRFGGSEPQKPVNKLGIAAPPSDQAAGAKGTPAGGAVDRSATTTTVLNGTMKAGLARSVANKLESAGFTIAEVADNTDQTLPQTVVYYSSGNERAARVVAQIVGIKRNAVQPITRDQSVLSSGARVVVTVGADSIE